MISRPIEANGDIRSSQQPLKPLLPRGSLRSYNTQELDSIGIKTSFNVSGGVSDAIAPTLISYQLSSYDIDLSAGDAVIDVTARITDDISGVFDGSSPAWNAGASQCRWRSPSGQIFWGGYFDNSSSGTSLDDVYTDRLTLSRFSENGVWTLEHFEVVDEAGNLRSYNTQDLDSIGIRTSFNVSGGVSDAIAPTLISYQLSSYDIDLSAGDAVIDVTARITDDISGVFDGSSPAWNAGASQCRWRSPSGQIFWGGYFDDFSSGTSLDGVYTDRLTLSKYAEKGVWSLEHFEVVDESGNLRRYDTTELTALGISTTFTVKGNWIQSTTSITLSSSVDNVELTGVQSINDVGSSIGNIMLGNSANNLIKGLQGNDQINGGRGNDTLEGGDGDDQVDGGEGDDLIVGGNGRGNDRYTGGIGTDTVRYTSALAAITVNLATGIATSTAGGDAAGIGTDTLSGIENIITGNFNDTLTGNSQNNRLDGWLGADTMRGGLGNDTYIVDNAVDRVEEAAFAGTDSVQSSITHTLWANVENLTLTGSGGINGTGNGLNNLIIGNGAANVLDGGNGNDSLNGGGGNDRLIGGNRNDNLNGGAGADTLTGIALNDTTLGRGTIDVLTGGTDNDLFVLGNASGVFYSDGSTATSGRGDYARITDFRSGDRIQLKGKSTDYVLRANDSISGFRGVGLYRNDGVGTGASTTGWDSRDEFIALIQVGSGVSLNLGNTSRFTYIA